MFQFMSGVLLAAALVIVFDRFYEWRKRAKQRASHAGRSPERFVEEGTQAA